MTGKQSGDIWLKLIDIIAYLYNVKKGSVVAASRLETDLCGDDLDFHELIFRIEEDFCISLADEELDTDMQVKQLYALILRELGIKEAIMEQGKLSVTVERLKISDGKYTILVDPVDNGKKLTLRPTVEGKDAFLFRCSDLETVEAMAKLFLEAVRVVKENNPAV